LSAATSTAAAGVSIDDVIVVIGRPVAAGSGASVHAGGLAGGIARTAVAAGATVQLVTRIADDPAGDLLVHAIAAAGIGHVATLRQPPAEVTPTLDAADLELALRYLAEIGVIVLIDGVDDEGIRAVAADAASWGRAPLIVIQAAGATVPDDLPSGTTVLEGPRSDPDDAFAGFVGAFAAALDRGETPATAFEATLGSAGGWSPVATD
jgi:hypothetical protein